MTNLSPTAQAVMNAWIENTNYAPIDNEPFALAAALCALADQVEPDDGISAEVQQVLNKILAIATELEGK
jgi:type IV secretory pathway VirB2 component (pilin)